MFKLQTFGWWITWFISNWEQNNCCQSWANSKNAHSFSLKLVILSENTVHSRFNKADLRKILDLRKIVATTNFSGHKLFDSRKIFQGLIFYFRKIFFSKRWKNKDFLVILEQFLWVFSYFFQHSAWYSTIQFIFPNSFLF